MVAPQPAQVHLDFSRSTRLAKPSAFMILKFSIMLMPYFVRYLLSKQLSRSHGKLAQSVQKLPPTLRLEPQVLILHVTRVFGLPRSSPLQPGHLFRLRKNARQSAQFMPHGAISSA